MRTRTLMVEGITYYCEYRKCGKAGCKCAGGDDLHGPYWYSRDAGGNVAYIGRELPEEIDRVSRIVTWSRGDLDVARNKLLEQAGALWALSHSASLTAKQRDIIQDLGFDYCLVSPGDAAATQERTS